MKLKDQVLSIEQVQELKKLGLDVREHSSMYYLPYYNSSSYKIDGYILDTIEKNDSFNSIPTMTIGDIINVLPFKIDTHYFLSVNSEYCAYSMSGDFDTIFFTREKEIMNNLFKTLVWCIKEKHI